MNKAVANYQTITIKLDKTEQLDMLARESGRAYSKTISYLHKIHDRKGIWLSSTQMQKIIHFDKLHSQTTQAIIQKYFASLKSYFRNHKSNSDAKPPHKTPKYFGIPFKHSAIHIHDGMIEFSCGKGNQPLIVKLPKNKTLGDYQTAEITWNNGYYLNIVVKLPKPEPILTGKIIAVDPGEIHPLSVFDGEKGTIYNGRLLRSEKQYLNKVKASFTAKLSHKKRGSQRRHKLAQCKARTIKRLNNRVRDIEHKITRHFVETCKNEGVSTVVYGDTTHIRQNCDYGKKTNQKIHQWAFARIRNKVACKLAAYGIDFVPINERGTSHACPRCGSHVNPNGRQFKCLVCGFQCHRDLAGAINILSKYQGQAPVVASMAHATGVRFNWNLCCSESNLRIPSPLGVGVSKLVHWQGLAIISVATICLLVVYLHA